MNVSAIDAAIELQSRRKARLNLSDYITYTNPRYKPSVFSETVCMALAKFMDDVAKGLRPVLIFQAPPQHGKSEIVSRSLPSFLHGQNPNLHIASVSYNTVFAQGLALDVRRKMDSDAHLRLFPAHATKDKYQINRAGERSVPGGTGTYKAVGKDSGLTGNPVDIAIVDDPVKNAQEALSPTTKESDWNWYQSVLSTRMSENSGTIIMATSWAEDDLAGRVIDKMRGDPRLTILRFPAINDPDEAGYRPDLPLGPLVPGLHSLAQLTEIKTNMSDYWWSAMYQQSPRSLGGNVFKQVGVRYYLPKDLPEKFDKIIASWDCTFKDTDGSDYVVGQVWGRKGPNVYLLDQVRERMSFTRTVAAVEAQRLKWPGIRQVLIEDKANGPAVIDTLRPRVPGLVPIEPDGSKLARAHAITWLWEAGNVYLPHEDIAPWAKELVAELLSFPAAANDDQVDALTQGLRHLFPVFNRLAISPAAIARASGYTRPTS